METIALPTITPAAVTIYVGKPHARLALHQTQNMPTQDGSITFNFPLINIKTATEIKNILKR
jgi:hypothetical protein